MNEGWERSAREDLAPKMRGAAFVITLSPGDEPDPKVALETGYAILLNKPLLVVGWPGRPIPEGLRRAATEIVELAGPIDSIAGQAQVQAAIASMVERTA